jgi:hypothetical protein
MPMILSPGTNYDKQSRKHDEDATGQGTGPTGPARVHWLCIGQRLQSILPISLDFTLEAELRVKGTR